MAAWNDRRGRRTRNLATRRPVLECLESRLVLSTFTVTNVNDSGAGSFRQAITDANSTPNAAGTTDMINFNIAGTGLHTITASSALPDIGETVTINGYSQPGSKANTQATGALNSVLLISVPGFTVTSGHVVLQGLDFPTGGLVIKGDTNRVEGCYIGTNNLGTVAPGLAPGAATQTGILVLGSSNLIGGTDPGTRNLISGNNSAGVLIQGGASGNTLEGNLIGTQANGATALGNAVGVRFESSTSNKVGGTDTGAGNVIAGNSYAGVWLFNASNSVIEGNLIGTTATGQTALANQNFGVAVDGTTGSAMIGGTTAAARNIISGNNGPGVLVATRETGHDVRGTYIGVAADGTTALGNVGPGIRVARADKGMYIGGTIAAAANLISHNLGAGVTVDPASSSSSAPAPTAVSIRTNQIYNNQSIGIDLGSDGTTNNHNGGPVSGQPNGQLNTPVLSAVTSDGSTTSITGSYNGAPSTTYTLQFFSSPFASFTSRGDGLTYLGQTTVTTDSAGNASYLAGMPVPVGAGKPVSAIAIDPTGNTSEFSADSAFAFSSPVNLAVVLSQVASPIGTGQPFTYTATVTNNGTNTANNISLVCAAFGGGVQVDAAKTTINQGTISVETGGIYATIGSLAPGISAKATITATATQSGQINLTGLTYSSEPETTTTDNSTHEVVTVAAAPDLVVQGSGPSSVAINQPATFTFTVRNSGSGAASGVKLTIPLPTGSSYSNGTTSQGSIGQTGTSVLVDIGTMAANAVITVKVPVAASAQGTLSLTATATLTETDPTPANNSTTVSVTVLSAPNMQTVVTSPGPNIYLGQIATYLITITNHGQTTANNVVVNANLSPAGEFINTFATQGTSTSHPGTVQAALGSIKPGESAVVTVNVRPIQAGVATLGATTTSTEPDADPQDNTGAASVTVVAQPTPTHVTRIKPVVQNGRIRSYEITFSDALDSDSASRIGAYRVIAPGPSGVLGAPGSRNLPLSYATYDDSLHKVTLVLKQLAPMNQFIGIVAYGTGGHAIHDSHGQPIDGDNRGVVGTDLMTMVGRGNRLAYSDADGDRVLLQIQGPGGLVIFRTLGQNAIVLTAGTSPYKSKLIGGVKRTGSAGNGVTYISQFYGLENVINRLPSNKFVIQN